MAPRTEPSLYKVWQDKKDWQVSWQTLPWDIQNSSISTFALIVLLPSSLILPSHLYVSLSTCLSRFILSASQQVPTSTPNSLAFSKAALCSFRAGGEACFERRAKTGALNVNIYSLPAETLLITHDLTWSSIEEPLLSIEGTCTIRQEELGPSCHMVAFNRTHLMQKVKIYSSVSFPQQSFWLVIEGKALVFLLNCISVVSLTSDFNQWKY